MCNTYGGCCGDSWKIPCSSRQRSANFTPHLCPSMAQDSIQMDPAKVSAVVDWPIMESRKQLQRFLGFANFYQWFIRNYSSVAAPLTCLTSIRRAFEWTPEAAEPSGLSRRSSRCLPSSKFRIWSGSSWWRWTPGTLEWGQYCLREP